MEILRHLKETNIFGALRQAIKNQRSTSGGVVACSRAIALMLAMDWLCKSWQITMSHWLAKAFTTPPARQQASDTLYVGPCGSKSLNRMNWLLCVRNETPRGITQAQHLAPVFPDICSVGWHVLTLAGAGIAKEGCLSSLEQLVRPTSCWSSSCIHFFCRRSKASGLVYVGSQHCGGRLYIKIAGPACRILAKRSLEFKCFDSAMNRAKGEQVEVTSKIARGSFGNAISSYFGHGDP